MVGSVGNVGVFDRVALVIVKHLAKRSAVGPRIDYVPGEYCSS